MDKILNFTKMAGAGNDFIVIDSGPKGLSVLAKKICARKTGIGADGVLAIEKSMIADFKMRIFNADGSEAEMCGNGLRCAVLYAGIKKATRPQGRKAAGKRYSVETKAGIYEGEITGDNRVKIRMEEPKDLKLGLPLNVNDREIKADFINTGVPHAVIFVEGIDKINVETIGSAIRRHKEFKPKGANVNFVEMIDNENIKIRTYERGVEAETLSCGTGSLASAIITGYKALSCDMKAGKIMELRINVHTRGGILKVEFQKDLDKIRDVYLEGEAGVVFEGRIIL